MNNQSSESAEARFITREFAHSMEGETPSPYFRLHDPAQKMLADVLSGSRNQPLHETAYPERMIHFWREVSLAGLPRTGPGMDECYALLFEAAFDLAEAEPAWALECLDQRTRDKWPWELLDQLAQFVPGHRMGHSALTESFAAIYAPRRERDDDWKDPSCVVASGIAWFWAALLSAAGISEDHSLWGFRCAVASASAAGWHDNGRLHTRLIREAPRWAKITPRIELMGHPILRIARLKYAEESIEQGLVLRFLNQQCIAQGFESETDHFSGDLTLALWVREARVWAATLMQSEPETCFAMFHEAGDGSLETVRDMFRREIGPCPEEADDLDATSALMRWAKRQRGFEYSAYRAQLWEFVVEMMDAALWLGWLFPAPEPKTIAVAVSEGNPE